MKRPFHALTQPGWAILLAIVVLLGFGLASIAASDSVMVGGRPVPSSAFAIKQAMVAVVSLAISAMILQIGYLRIGRVAFLVFGACLFLLVPLVLARYLDTSFGGLTPRSRGAYRWIHFPLVPLQPSELMKIGYILGLAWYLRFRKNYRTLTGLLLPFGMSVIPMILILLEPDLGTVLLFFPVLFGMLYVAGARLSHLAVVVALGIAVAPLMWFKMHAYQRSRVMAVAMQSKAFRDRVAAEPEKYRFTGVDRKEALRWEVSSGMQLVRSKAALGSGGLTGQGWGHGTYVQYNILPDRHNDFVFAIVGHQWGLVGCLIVLGCYIVIVLAGIEIATVTDEPFGRLLAIGVVCLIAAQTLINVGMTIGLMPVTGMTLPFVSQGGSSLLANFLATALLVSVSQHRPYLLARKPFEWRENRRGFASRSRRLTIE